MNSFLDMYEDLRFNGLISSPRGHKILELQDYALKLCPTNASIFTSFNARKFNLDYLKYEFLWYLRANPFDDIIAEAAQMWKDIAQPDGSYFSNYGQYWFGPQNGFGWVVEELVRDKDSRRAVIPMLNKDHLFASNKDVVCTESISFRIRNDMLYMSVNMRSQDAIWGLSNDAPCFAMLWEMVRMYLKKYYRNLAFGTYCHKVDSLHVYERHFDMLDRIIDQGKEGWYLINKPAISSPEEVELMIQYHTKDNHCEIAQRENYRFFNWLLDNRYEADKR